jgi:hypothetical protein
MNERIEQLAEQCGFRSDPDIYDRNQSFDIEKFAELIVRECVRYFNEDYQRDFDTLWREDLSKGIKEHFGVNG